MDFSQDNRDNRIPESTDDPFAVFDRILSEIESENEQSDAEQEEQVQTQPQKEAAERSLPAQAQPQEKAEEAQDSPSSYCVCDNQDIAGEGTTPQVTSIESDSNEETTGDSLSDYNKSVEQAQKEAEDNMSQADLDDFLKTLAENKEKKQQQEKISNAPYIKEFPPDYCNAFENSVPKDKEYSISDGLIHSVVTLGKVNIEYISAMSGKNAHQVIEALTANDSIYQNPAAWNEKFSEGWELSTEYLSGNLFAKLKDAKTAFQTYGDIFSRNVAAINAIMKDKIPSEEIYVTLGSPWIPASLYNEFFIYLFKPRYKNMKGITYDEFLKCWDVDYKITSGFDVKGMSGVEIFERTLNNKPVTIFLNVKNHAMKGRPVDTQATLQSTEVQKNMIMEFRNWIFNSPDRKEYVEQLYFEMFGSITARKFNGSFLELPGKNPNIHLYQHQLDAIARIIMTPSTLLAHAVGSGKTYIMISAGMEMKRTGLSPKNMYVVPNQILDQWVEDFHTLYPACNLLVVDRKSMTKAKKEETLAKVRDNDYDAIIVTYSQFKAIPAGITAQVADLKERINKLGSDHKYDALKNDYFKKIADLDNEKKKKGKVIYFEDLGVTSLFVDEAHHFKNVRITLNASQLGIGNAYSAQANDMFQKVNILRRNKAHKSIVFATGTPITNSITELYVMQSYLQPDELKYLKLDSFDNWALTFGETSSNFEVDVDSKNCRVVDRFNRFHNLPELTSLFGGVADFHLEEIDEIFTQTVDYHNVVVDRSPEQAAYVDELAERTENIRKKITDRKADNLLKVTVDGRLCALDIRLVNPSAKPKKTKTQVCADEVAKIYFNRPQVAQLVFCDNSTPKNKFNIYDELKSLLLAKGIPASDVEFVQTAKDDSQKQVLFNNVNNGRIKILVGSTQTLGTGVNVQKRLYAIHHLDVPWKPSEMVQREGRMIRQGNTNDNVEIFRYVTDSSFDSYSWQLLENKQKFICQLLSGSIDQRDGDELNELVLSYAEVKALTIGDPRIKERVETSNELDRLRLKKASVAARHEYLKAKSEDIPKVIAHDRDYVKCLEKDHRIVSSYKKGIFGDMGEKILQARAKGTNSGNKILVGQYRGIDIYLLDSALETMPRIILKGNYEKLLTLTAKDKILSANGIMQRIDDYYDGLLESIKNVNVKIFSAERELEQVQKELNEPVENIDEKIRILKTQLEQLDIALEVDIDE